MGFIISMDHETDTDPILALDKQIAEREAEIIQLKRSRNSLLRIARIPPEVLGCIFQMNLVSKLPRNDDDRFATIHIDSYDFLLVCHHWYEVACRTPELWSCWGHNLVDWNRRCLRFENSPLDLVLDGAVHQAGTFDETIRGALKSRALRDLVRRVHLKPADGIISASIISSLTPEDDIVRHSSIESIVLTRVDVATFFARHCFPKLWYLSLSDCSDFALDHLKPHTKALISLFLHDDMISPPSIPTTSQILSLLSSNPQLQHITLHLSAINDDSASGYGFQVPLRHLKRFSLGMDPRCALAILQRLGFPDGMDQLNLRFYSCGLEVARQIVGPYIRDRLEGDERSKSRLGISASSIIGGVSFEVSVPDVGSWHPTRPRNRVPPYATFTTVQLHPASRGERHRLCIDILALLPQERIVRLDTNISAGSMEELLINAPNIEMLHLTGAVIFEWFLLPDPSGPNAHKKLLPSLRWLYLEDPVVDDDDWDPLVRCLVHQTSGDQSISLSVFGEGVHICSNLQEKIRSLVDLFLYDPDLDKDCPFDYCSDSD